MSRQAENFAANLLTPGNDTIYVFCVVEAIPLGEIESDQENTSDVKSRLTDEAEFIIDSAIERLTDQGFEVESGVSYGDAGEIICDEAESTGADAIIMGRQGKGRMEELLLGSVSSYVIHHATVPVITVPKDS